MKKNFLLAGVFVFFACLFLSGIRSRVKATCYYTSNPGYGDCLQSHPFDTCKDSNNYTYACCNDKAHGDTCPVALNNYSDPNKTPVPKNPNTDPTCGGTSQICCSGNTCDSSSLKCTLAKGGGYYCLDQGQKNAVNGYYPDTAAQAAAAYKCDGETGIKTAIGCIPVLSSTNDLLGVVLKWAVGIGGGIAFALMLYAGFMIMTASGNPERIKAGQELLTSAIAGLILLVFSIFILRFIGVDILGLNQFGFNQ